MNKQLKTNELVAPPKKGSQNRGRYLTIQQVPVEYPIFSVRLLRRLVYERRISFSRAGRYIVFSETDIESYLEKNRVESVSSPWEINSLSGKVSLLPSFVSSSQTRSKSSL
ncbi:MAG: helix-turn-helix domain-containing protein [Acidimicrobiales bacterium]|nr:helix-turn-helix domain-containing protein [Acidimicrobiales bacterium]